MLASLLVCYVILQGALAQESCTDISPDSVYSCQQQKDWGKCSHDWMKSDNYCAKTCERCGQQKDDFACGLEGECVFAPAMCDATTATRCADSDCSARESNIQGDLVLLDVNSQSYNAGPNHPPQVTNPADCCDQCKQTLGCNAWVFCSNRDGCGSGCSEYIDSLNLNLAEDFDNPLGFGQFGGCTGDKGDKYPWLMCSLKKVSDVNNLEEESVGEDGWVSGAVVQTS